MRLAYLHTFVRGGRRPLRTNAAIAAFFAFFLAQAVVACLLLNREMTAMEMKSQTSLQLV